MYSLCVNVRQGASIAYLDISRVLVDGPILGEFNLLLWCYKPSLCISSGRLYTCGVESVRVYFGVNLERRSRYRWFGRSRPPANPVFIPSNVTWPESPCPVYHATTNLSKIDLSTHAILRHGIAFFK